MSGRGIEEILVEEGKKRLKLRAIVDSYMSIQKIRIGAENRLRNVLMNNDEFEPVRLEIMNELTKLRDTEKGLEKLMKKYLKEIEVYNIFLKHIKGLGNVYSAKLLSLNLDITKSFDSWLAYFGLIPHYYLGICKNGHKFMYSRYVDRCPVDILEGNNNSCEINNDNGKKSNMTIKMKKCNAEVIDIQKYEEAPRKKCGIKSFWNSKARALYYLIARQFILIGDRGYYGRLYRKCKEKIMNREDIKDIPYKRKVSMAFRITFKVFLSNFYEAYCDSLGIEPKFGKYYRYLMDKGVWISYKDVLKEETSK